MKATVNGKQVSYELVPKGPYVWGLVVSLPREDWMATAWFKSRATLLAYAGAMVEGPYAIARMAPSKESA